MFSAKVFFRYAVLALDSEMDMKTLQERLGHGNDQVTANVYAHVYKKLEEKAIDKYEEYMKNVF